MDPVLIEQYRTVADALVGHVDWQDGVKGFCPCPGRHLHTSAGSRRNCVVFIDPDRVPTIYCVHTSCTDIVALRNHSLRSGCAKAKWALERSLDPVAAPAILIPSPQEHSRRRRARKLELLATRARRGASTLLSDHRWPVGEIVSPVALDDRPANHWRQILSLFDPAATVWIGDRHDSGEPRHTTRFRTASRWLEEESTPPGPLLCASVFRSDCHARSAENVLHTPYLVVESDTLARDEVTGVFRFLYERMRLPLRAIIDTGGRSLHAWFDQPPPSKRREELLVVLQALGCDPGPWRTPSMSRLPGAKRRSDAGLRQQRLLWLDPPQKRSGASGAV